jgi:glycosyltransferase involved in cell wall biosynthesis
MKIRLIGQRNSLGIGQHYANFADALRRRSGLGHLVEEVDFTDAQAMQQAAEASTDQDINIGFVANNLQDFFRGRIIQWVVFETTQVSAGVLGNIQQADQIWVPSEWGRDILIAHGTDPDIIHVVPEGVDADQHWPAPKSVTGALRFLFVGKYEQRKSVTELIDAFDQAFTINDGVELIVKTNYFVHDADRVLRLQQQINRINRADIMAHWGYMTPEEMLMLYRSSHVFVFPTKGEGWGLPIIEAAAQGLPIVTTLCTAQQDYLRPIATSCEFVDWDLVPVDCPDYRFYYPDNETWGSWAQPRQQSLVDALRRVKHNYHSLAQQAVINSDTIRQQWNWTRCADRALEVLTQTRCLSL